MNTTQLPFQDQQAPTIAQLFGSNYIPEYLQYLPEIIKFKEGIVPRIDFRITRKLLRTFSDNRNLQLQIKHPSTQSSSKRYKKNGRFKNASEFNKLRITSVTESVFVCMLEMYTAFLNTVREGRTNATFTLQPSAVASRCNIASINTVKTHWYKLEEAGAIKKGKMNFDQSYTITFNPELLCAQKDKNFAKEIADLIIHKAPGLQKNENFREWRKRLNPSFFPLCTSPTSQILMSYLLSKQEHNINSDKRNFFSDAETASTAISKNTGEQLKKAPEGDLTAALGAKKEEAGAEPQKKNIAWDMASAAEKLARNFSLNNSREKEKTPIQTPAETPASEKNKFIETAFSMVIGIMYRWWAEDIKNGKIPEHQITTTKAHLHQWIFGKGQKLSPHEFFYGFMCPVLHNLRRAMNKNNYGFKPPLYLFFDPNWNCHDGSPAGFRKSIIMFKQNNERIKKLQIEKKLNKYAKEKVKKLIDTNEIFCKAFRYVLRNPSEKKYLKAAEKIKQLNDKELMNAFVHAIEAENILPAEFMQRRKIIIHRNYE